MFDIRNKANGILCFLYLLIITSTFSEKVYGRSSPDPSMPYITTTQPDTGRIAIAYQVGLQKHPGNLAYWDSLATAAQRFPTSSVLYRILLKQGDIQYQTNEPKAMRIYLNAIALAETNGLKAQAIPFIEKLCSNYSAHYSRQETLRWAYKGLRLAEEVNDPKKKASFYGSIALYYLTSKEPLKALNIYQKCLYTYSAAHDSLGIPGTLLDIGTAYLQLNDDKNCITYYLRSKNYLPYLGESIYAIQVMQSISCAYLKTGRHDSASYYANSAYTMARRLQSKKAIVSSLISMGAIEKAGRNMKGAEKYFRHALNQAIAINFIAQLPEIYEALVQVYETDHQYRKALRYHRMKAALTDSLSGENQRKRAMEEEFAHQIYKKETAYQLLEQTHYMQSIMYRKNQYLLYGSGTLLIAILLVVWLLRRQNKLTATHRQMMMERRLLLSQMNPHFLFNSMNAIHQLMSDQENNQARIYITQFAKLTRSVLENSTKESISIGDEKEMLEAYLRMESLRFETNFSYQLSIAGGLDPQHTFIPHLMIQPFVENAIWHGLLPKKGEKKLHIEFLAGSGKNIRCIIEDNGIGRDEARKNQDQYKKTSLAMSFVTQRISLIRKTLRTDGGLRITDKKDAEGYATGTRVELILPVI
jgi:hypothetical protein